MGEALLVLPCAPLHSPVGPGGSGPRYATGGHRARGRETPHGPAWPKATSTESRKRFNAAKGGLLALTRALAVKLGPEVRANAVCPAWIETGPWQRTANRREPDHTDADRKQHPVGRVGTPADIVAAVVFLASPEAGFVTGQRLVVDSGMTRRMIYAD